MPLAPLQLPLNGLSKQVRTLLALVQGGIHSRQRPGREPGWHLFLIDLFSPHS